MRLLAALSRLLVSASFSQTPVKTAEDPARSIDIIGADDMKYSVTTIAAKRGQTLSIRLISKGTIPKVAMAHNVVVLKLGTDVLKLLADGAPHRGTDFIPPAMKDAVIARTPAVQARARPSR